MPIEEHLLPGEQILARAGKYYATDKRVIGYKKKLIRGEELEDLAYPHITSLSLVSHPRGILIYLGISLLAIGILGCIANIFVNFVLPVFILLIVFGIVSIVCGIVFQQAYFELRASGITEQERPRIKRVGSQEVKKFVSVVREHCYR